MPGANCSIYGCSTSRRHSDISIFKIPSPNNDFTKKWRNELVNIVTKDRIIDDNLQRQIDSNKLYICEKHFSEDQILICKYYLFFNRILLQTIFVFYYEYLAAKDLLP